MLKWARSVVKYVAIASADETEHSDPGGDVRARYSKSRSPRLRQALLLLGGAVGAGVVSLSDASAARLSYAQARTALRSVSELRQASEAGVNLRNYEARAADSLGLPEVSVNAAQVWGIKTGTIGTPLGAVDINQKLNGPRLSINATWEIYTGGRITATQRALAAGTDAARAESAVTDEKLDLQL